MKFLHLLKRQADEKKEKVFCKEDTFKYASDKEVRNATNKVVNRYRGALKELAKY